MFRRLLGRPLEVSLTKESGLAGIIFLINQHLGIDVGKDDPRLLALNDYVIKEFDAGRQTGIEWEELRPVVETHFREQAARGTQLAENTR